MSEGPFLWIAVPVLRDQETPVNATRLLREWERVPAPLDVLADALERSKDIPWSVDECFVEPSLTAAALMREAAERGFRDQLVSSGIRVRLRKRSSVDTDDARDWATGDTFRDHSGHLTPVMYGLAVFSVLRDLPGYHSAQAHEREQQRLTTAASADVREFAERLEQFEGLEPDEG